MRDTRLQEIAERLSVLTLDDADLDFDFVVSQLAEFRAEIDALESELGGSEPWAIEWLSAEHYKGAVLYVGAKTNYSKEVAAGRGYPFDPATRSLIIDRFNAWSREAQRRVEFYLKSEAAGAVVQGWQADLDAFRADPLRTR